MHRKLLAGVFLAATTLTACVAEEEVGAELTSSGTDNTLVGSTSTADEECKPGFQIGRCPNDIALPNSLDELVSVHDQRGSRVAVVGSAEY